jgi:hypothetical protein
MPWAGSIIVAYSSENRCKLLVETADLKPQPNNGWQFQ